MRRRTRGIALIPVALILTALAALALALSLHAGIQASGAVRDADADRAGYLAEAALQHARMAADAADCRNYPALAGTLGTGSYSAGFTPAAGAPVTIAATGSVGSASARRADTVIPRAATQTAVLQPAANGSDTYLDEQQPYRASGSEAEMFTLSKGNNRRRRALVRFDLTRLPPETAIVRAVLKLEVFDVSGGQNRIDVHRLTRAWRESHAAWLKSDAGLLDLWLGGDFASVPIGQFLAAVGPVEVDLTELVRAWHRGEMPNHGVLLKVADEARNEEQRYYTSDHGDPNRRPRLEITHACPCDTACGVPPAAQCDAAFVPNSQTGAFSTAALNNLHGLTALPPGTVVAGHTLHAGGWLLVEAGAPAFRVADAAGNLLGTLASPAGHPRDVAFIGSGAWFDHIAITDADDRIYLMDRTGALQGSFSTLGVADAPIGLDYIGTTASGTYDGMLATTSEKTPSGLSSASISILDQNGALLHVIDVSAFLAKPRGIAHLPGSDTLLVVDETGGAFVFGFDGSLTGQYDAGARFGIRKARGAAIHPQTCAHVIADADDRLVRLLTP